MGNLINSQDLFDAAYDQLGARARGIYAEYGDIMGAAPVHRGKLAKKTGASVNTIKQVLDFTELWGGPSNGRLAQLATQGSPLGAMHYIIPDAHFGPADKWGDFARARRLGVFIARLVKRAERLGQRLRVICLGDWWDMHSLCFYEKDTAGFGLHSVEADMDSGELALSVMMDAIGDYDPKKVTFTFTNGNHEKRLDKALKHREHGAMLRGNVRTHKAILEAAGWDFHPYMVPANVDGVAYAHCLPSGVMGRPIGGKNPSQTLLDKMHTSCVVGHSHIFNMSEAVDAFGNNLFAIVAGCYMEKSPDYAVGNTSSMWWRGTILLRGVKDGSLIGGHSTFTVNDMIAEVGY